MQTFITSKHPTETASCLDNKRLNKQALEAWQILMALTNQKPDGSPRDSKGWLSHPAVEMWRGSERYLLYYIYVMVGEWKNRGFKSTIYDKAQQTYMRAWRNGKIKTEDLEESTPEWIKDSAKLEKVIDGHRKALLVKDYFWYSRFGWEQDSGLEPDSYEYYWPEVEVK